MQPVDEEFWAAGFYLWLERHLPESRRVRIVGMVLLAAVVFALVVMLFLQPVLGDETRSDSRLLVYLGLFVICFASAFFLLFPIPGLSFAAIALVFQQGGYYEPVVVAIIACAGWSLGDVGIYVAGAVGSVSLEKQAPVPGRFRGVARNLMEKLQRLLNSVLGPVILAAVSFIPNPIAGASVIAAGVNRMSPARFGSGVVAGRLARGLLVAYAGSQVVNVG